MYFMLCKAIVLKSFVGYPKINKLQLWLSKDVEAKKTRSVSFNWQSGARKLWLWY